MAVGLIIGMFIGAFIGVLAICLAQIARERYPDAPPADLDRIHIENGNSDCLTTGSLQRPDLGKRRLNIPRIGAGHGLHNYRGVSADLNAAEGNRICSLSLDYFVQGNPQKLSQFFLNIT